MRIEYTDDQVALRAELKTYFDELMTPELLEEVYELEGAGPLYHRALKRMGTDGWLGIGWPAEYGGRERSAIEQFIFGDEVQRRGFPIPLLTLSTVGPTLMAHGTQEQKDRYLPAILRGEIHFCIGYTEPQAGTDLASLETRAVRDGDHYVVNGQKIFTSQADYADYIWTAVRTDPDVRKHKGISILIIPREAEGVSLTPIHTLGGNRVFTTYLENVRVPVENLVGEENGGWKLITSQLNHERVSLFTVGLTEQLLADITAWAAETPAPGGGVVLDRPWVRANLAKVHSGVDLLRLFNWRQAWNIGNGGLPPAEASAVKVYGSRFYIEANRLLMEVVGPAATLQKGSRRAVLAGRLERFYRQTLVLTSGGGANEVQRDIICMAGLRMPRGRR
jgi:alkylation response protein AidB-like acyl-CoA dehydrogenase